MTRYLSHIPSSDNSIYMSHIPSSHIRRYLSRRNIPTQRQNDSSAGAEVISKSRSAIEPG
jgi:hypothetical protein